MREKKEKIDVLHWSYDYYHKISAFEDSLSDPFKANENLVDLIKHVKRFINGRVSRRDMKRKMIEIINDLKMPIKMSVLHEYMDDAKRAREKVANYYNPSTNFLRSGYSKAAAGKQKDYATGDYYDEENEENLVNKIRYHRSLIDIASRKNSDLMEKYRAYILICRRLADLSKLVRVNLYQIDKHAFDVRI